MGDHLRRGAERMGERVDAAKEAMGDRVDAAREAMGDRASAAKGAMGDRVDAAREAVGDRVEAAAEAIAAIKPRLRGVTHEWAFFISLFLGGGLIVAADTPRATLAVSIYAVSLSALFGTSALYHRINWRPEVRRWMRRLDHTMIFILIAGTTTPFALLVMKGTVADAVLIAVWVGAAAGIVVELIWIEAPKWVAAIVYVAVGLGVGLLAVPQMLTHAGVAATALIAAGGALYATGAIIYAAQRPNPNPGVFGYHEIFHLLVIAAALAHFAAVAFFALPKA
jgi:hemolysin III